MENIIPIPNVACHNAAQLPAVTPTAAKPKSPKTYGMANGTITGGAIIMARTAAMAQQRDILTLTSGFFFGLGTW
jgi:hypothetical protein